MSETADRPMVRSKEWWVFAVLATAQLMIVLDVTIVNIALPDLQSDLDIADDARQWVVTAYSLAFGALLVLGGRLGDRFGRRGVFLLGAAGFAVASVAGGLAQDFAVLIAARAAQGAFAALMAPAALSLLSVSFASSTNRSRAFGLWGATTGAGGAVGLLLGGLLTEYLSWRWCLLVNVLFAAFALLGGLRVLPRSVEHDKPAINLPSAALISAALFGVVYGLSRAETDGWDDGWCLTGIVGGAVLLVVFLVLQGLLPRPLMPLRVLADRRRGGALTAILISGAGVFGVFLFVTFYLQQILGYSSIGTGIAFLPLVLMLGLVAATAGSRLLSVLGPRVLVPVGMLIAAAAMVMATNFDADTSYAAGVLPMMIVSGLGLGLVFAAAQATATLGLRSEDAGVGSAVVSTAQQVGGSIGVALLSTQATTAGADKLADLLTAAMTRIPTRTIQTQAALAGYHTAFWYAACFFAVGAVLTVVLYPSGRLARADVSETAALV